MKRWVVIAGVLLFAGALVAGGWWFFRNNPAWWSWLRGGVDTTVETLGIQPADPGGSLVASGFIEADDVLVTSDAAGRVVALSAEEGDDVAEDQVLVKLDDSVLMSQIAVAEADLAVAEAGLVKSKAAVRPETLAYAQALVDQAKAAQEAARVAWQDTQTMLENPQDLLLAITVATAQLRTLDYQEQQAEALAASANAAREFADEAARLANLLDPGDTSPWFPVPFSDDELAVVRREQALATYRSWEAWTGVTRSQAAMAGAEGYLSELLRQAANPLALQAQVGAAEAQFRSAQAAVGVAEAQLEGLTLGATPEQVAVVEAQVEIAQAALQALHVQAAKYVLKAPVSGLVLSRSVHVGELVLPGVPLMTLANLDELTLTVFVPEDRLGEVSLGLPVTVTVDAYPRRDFAGTVFHISDEAEFTPKNVQTQEERVNLVFAVKIRLSNPDHALKAGMPADAEFPEENQ